MFKKVLFAFVFALVAIAAVGSPMQADTVGAGKETFTSRIYLPGSIGISIPSSSPRTHISAGFSFNTAAEYRPVYSNSFFVRFNYDALNNKYTSFFKLVPTNVLTGKLTTNFFVLGAGYRWKKGDWGIYALVQPGLGDHSYERAAVGPDGVNISYVTNTNFGVKASAGVEYYLVRHFALTFEPAYYKIFSNKGFSASHSRYLAFNLGITTTIF